MEIGVADAAAMEALGAALAACALPACVAYLEGDLGAGKTTLVRGFLRGAGHAGAVTSPTYTLVEPYEVAGVPVYHFDLYRLGDPEELEFLGIRDYAQDNAVSLIEWPQQGEGMLPAADLLLRLEVAGSGRRVSVEARSGRGEAILDCLRSKRLPTPA